MLCDICKKNEATVHLTQVENNKLHKVDLCESCAKEKGVQDPTGFSLADLLVGLGAADEIKTEGEGAKCPECGFTQADFKKTGRLGCSACWETFEAGLASLLKAMHKGDHHVGKVPAKAMHTLALNGKIRELAEQLEKAVREEKYEDAAQIRDEIRGMVRFARLNLMDKWPMTGQFDLIMCRNVMFYFDNDIRKSLVRRFWEQLKPGAYLFVGHSESLSTNSPGFRYIQPAVYQKNVSNGGRRP